MERIIMIHASSSRLRGKGPGASLLLLWELAPIY